MKVSDDTICRYHLLFHSSNGKRDVSGLRQSGSLPDVGSEMKKKATPLEIYFVPRIVVDRCAVLESIAFIRVYKPGI